MIATRQEQFPTPLTLHFRGSQVAFEVSSLTLQYRCGTQNVTEVHPARSLSPATFRGVDAWAPSASTLLPLIRMPQTGTEQFHALELSVRSSDPGPAYIERVSVTGRLVFQGQRPPLASLSWLRNGWQSWSWCGMLPANNPTFPMPTRDFAYRIKEDADVSRTQAPYWSDMLGGVRWPDAALLFGARGQSRFQNVVYEVQGEDLLVHLEIDADSLPLAPGASADLGGWELQTGPSLTALAEQWAHRRNVPHSPKAPLMAWCSWYQRGPRITHVYIKETVDLLKQRKEFSPVTLVQVDDGYQSRVGDWLTPSGRYGAHIKDTARMITDSGYKAGLWVAPFIAQQRSELFAKHPNWFLRRGNDFYSAGWNPFWLDTIRALDTSNPEVQRWLHETFSRLVEYGFTFFKLDYLYPAAIRARRFNNEMGRFLAFKKGLEVIREAVGPDITLLGCGAPLAPSIGIVDAMRVSVDIDVTWENPAWLRLATGDTETTGLAPAIRNSLTRGPFIKPLFRIDPDCLLLRSKGSTLTPEQRELAMQLAGVHGEWVLLGDDITRWGEEQFQLFERFKTMVGTDAAPLDSLDQLNPDKVRVSLKAGESTVSFKV